MTKCASESERGCISPSALLYLPFLVGKGGVLQLKEPRRWGIHDKKT